MKYTDNFDLKLPENIEQFDLQTWNDNWNDLEGLVMGEGDDRRGELSRLRNLLEQERTERAAGDVANMDMANTEGVLPVSKGGTGVTTLQAGLAGEFGALAAGSLPFGTDPADIKVVMNIGHGADCEPVCVTLADMLDNMGGVHGTVGMIVAWFGNGTPPAEWLLCDGSAFSADSYPLLYEFLGKNVTPDLRECALVGAFGNTTHAIETHFKYSIGWFSDDCFQYHRHTFSGYGAVSENNNGAWERYCYTNDALDLITSVGSGRSGDVTRGKRKGCNFIIRGM